MSVASLIAEVQRDAKPCKRSGVTIGRDRKEYKTPTLADVWESVAAALAVRSMTVGHMAEVSFVEALGPVVEVTTTVMVDQEQLNWSIHVPFTRTLVGMSAAITFGKRMNLQNAFNIIPPSDDDEVAATTDEEQEEAAKAELVQLLAVAKDRKHIGNAEARQGAGVSATGPLSYEEVKKLTAWLRKEIG